MKQETRQNILDTSSIVSIDEIKKVIFPLYPGDRIFLCGDLGAGKTTLVRELLRQHFHDQELIVRSPTYTYFQKYESAIMSKLGTKNSSIIYHFDLYRVDSMEDILLIGAADIFDDPTSICLIEWPERIMHEILPTVVIEIEKISETERKFTLRGSNE